MLQSKLDELLVPNLPFLVVVVVEEHHRGLVAHRAFEILACLDLHQPDAAVAHGALVPESMRFLDDDFALHPGQIGQIGDLLSVRAGEDGGCPQRQRRRRARRHHGRLGAHQRRDPLAHAIVELVEHHVVLRRVVDRLHDLRRHQRRRHRRVGPRRIDEGAHPELAEVVAPGGLRGARRQRRRRAGEGFHDRQAAKTLQKMATTPHGEPHVPGFQRFQRFQGFQGFQEVPEVLEVLGFRGSGLENPRTLEPGTFGTPGTLEPLEPLNLIEYAENSRPDGRTQAFLAG